MNKLNIIRAFTILLALSIPASAITLKQRTFRATVVRVSDADTIVVHVPGWPLPFDPMKVRLDGLDTPETVKGLYKCLEERRLGFIAKAWLKERLPVGAKVTLVWTGIREKYGRLLAVVYSNKENINATLVRLGYAKDYHGATKISWCAP